MADFYRRMRGYPWNTDYITGAHGRRLLDEARAVGADDPPALPVEGIHGISFIAGRVNGSGGMRIWLRPVARELVPPEILERLERAE